MGALLTFAFQPFTCTFPNCGEPKSFKRKADWVRHESERHRHLESWKCDVPECQHVCYRKDNFVQHLVREHRYPEPRVRLGRAASRGSSNANDDSDIVAHLVEKCRFESSQQPTDEPCRFCGNLCNSWKKLTVHLAKHMEQISMPILELIGHEIPQSSSDQSFAGGQARFSAMRDQQSTNGVQGMSRSQLPSVSVTNTTGSTYPPQNLSRGRAVTDTRIGNGAYSPQANGFMNQSHSPALSSNGDYSFTYQHSPSFASHTPQMSPYGFPGSFNPGSSPMQQKSVSLSGGQFMNQNTNSADVSSFPGSWTGGTQMQNSSSQMGSTPGWQEPHLSASPIEGPLHTMTESEFAAKTGYGGAGQGGGAFAQHGHHQFPQAQEMKSNVNNTWTFNSNRDMSQSFMQNNGVMDGNHNATYPPPGNHNFAPQRMMNAQTNFNDWTGGQRFGDFYGTS